MINKEKLARFIKEYDNGSLYKEGAVSFIFNCPRCSKPKLYLHKENGRFICFHCVTVDNFRGKGEYALTEIYDLTIESVKERIYDYRENLASHLKLELFDIWDGDFGYEDEDLQTTEWDPTFVTWDNPQFSPGLEYLKSRGLGMYTIKKYDIRYSPIKRRIMFPVKADGDLYGWQGRYIKNTEFVDSTGKTIKIPKVLTSTGLKKERILMFQDNLIGSNHCILTEGPVSALKGEFAGGAVASMGKAVSDHQLNIIKSRVNKLYLALDPDAVNEIDSIARKLYGDVELYILLPPKGREDLGDCTMEEVYEQFLKAPKLCGQIHMSLK